MSTGIGTNAVNNSVVIAPLETPLGTARLFGTARGLLMVALPGEMRDFTEAWLRREARGARIIEEAAALTEARAQLAEYFAGERRAFDLALDWRGTPLDRK